MLLGRRAPELGRRVAAGRRLGQQRRQVEVETAGGIFEVLHQSLAPGRIGRRIGGDLEPEVERRPPAAALGLHDAEVEAAADVARIEGQGLAEGGFGGRRDAAFGGVGQGLALGHADVGAVLDVGGPAIGPGRLGIALEHAIGAAQHEPALAVVGVLLQPLSQTSHRRRHVGNGLGRWWRAGRPAGQGYPGLVGRPQPKVEPGRRRRQGQGQAKRGHQVGLAAGGLGLLFLGLVLGGGQQAALDLGPRRFEFARRDGAAFGLGL